MFELSYKADVAGALDRVNAWWNCAVLDRPAVQVIAPAQHRREAPTKMFSSTQERWLDAEYVVARADAHISSTYFGGDILPMFMPNVGPDYAAASLGAPLSFGNDTSWSAPIVDDLDNTPELKVDPCNRYVQAILEHTKVGLEVGKGKFLVGITDLHPGGDLAAALRDPQQLCLDIADAPGRVHELMDRIRPVFYDLYRLQDDLIMAAGQHVRTTWIPLYSTGRYYVPSCDFAALVSPRTFNEFFFHEIAEEVEWLDHSIFHLDGPDAVRHLDTLCSLKKLQAIQFVVGAGGGSVASWMHVFKRIQAAGKAMHISIDAAELDEFMQSLHPEGVMLAMSAPSIEEAESIIKRVSCWT